MINRYTITASLEQLSQRFAVEITGNYTPRYNAAPAQLLPVILSSGRKGLSWFYWGKPPAFANNKPLGEKVINLPVESLLEKPVLKKILMQNRCIIPADGWYCWKKIGKKTLVPHRLTLTDKSLFSFAGIWEEFEDDAGVLVHTFTIITTKATEAYNSFAERMPVILTQAQENIWLNSNASEHALMEVLQPIPENVLTAYTVSPRINDLVAEHPSLILPAPSSDQFGNLTLFN